MSITSYNHHTVVSGFAHINHSRTLYMVGLQEPSEF